MASLVQWLSISIFFFFYQSSRVMSQQVIMVRMDWSVYSQSRDCFYKAAVPSVFLIFNTTFYQLSSVFSFASICCKIGILPYESNQSVASPCQQAISLLVTLFYMYSILPNIRDLSISLLERLSLNTIHETIRRSYRSTCHLA